MSMSVDPAYLVDLEALMYALEHGRARTPEVTLPGAGGVTLLNGAEFGDRRPGLGPR
jgi:hypothetical protein